MDSKNNSCMRNHQLKILLCTSLIFVMVITGYTSATENTLFLSSPDLKNESCFPISLESKNIQVTEDPITIYEIKLVSPELLQTIITNMGSEDNILKIGPGMTIGVSTPQVLYIRSDLQSDEYLLKNRNSTDMKDEIVQHLLNIAFGRDNSNLDLFHHDRKYQIWFDSEFTQDDIQTSLEFAKTFNNLSTTTQFEDESVLKGDLKDNYAVIPYYYFNVKIVSKEYLDDYKKNHFKSATEEELKDKGTFIGILSHGYVYLWNGLSGNERKYYLIKSLLWNLGLHGETQTDPDSFFSSKTNKSVNLSDLDKEAIKLLYGGRLSSNLTADQVRKALDISY